MTNLWSIKRRNVKTLNQQQNGKRHYVFHIEIEYMYGDYWLYDLLRIPNHDLIGLSDRNIVKYENYEEALRAGIFEVLELI